MDIDKNISSDEEKKMALFLKQQNELLKNQLFTNSLVNELTKVLHTTNPDNIYKTIILGIKDIIGFDRIILFDLNKKEFCLTPKSWLGFKDSQLDNFVIPLGFEGGEIADSIFLNRHLMVEETCPGEDIFCDRLGSNSYVVLPLVARTISTYENSENSNMFSDSIEKYTPNLIQPEHSSVDTSLSEDDRRKQIIASQDFKTNCVFWMDRTKKSAPITSEDISTLVSIVTQSGIIIENINMYNALEKAHINLKGVNSQLQIVNQDLRNAQTKIQMDLEHAKTVQQGLLPQQMPKTPALNIHATYIPADAVGGDYYDAFEIEPGIYGIIIADVSGHGVASALIMTMVKVLLKTLANSKNGPQKTLEKINDIFQAEIQTTNFVTVFYAILDTNRNTFQYSSAGHCPSLFLDKSLKKCESVKANGLFLGVFPDMMLSETCHEYKPGTQRIILYTDGLTEAKNETGEMFELDRLIDISIKTLNDSPEDAVNKIHSFQKKFCGKKKIPEDDITFLVIDF
ncbi:MAG: PP2C family protein-serine/threonine phosphatase [Chitinispirillia bacterium]|jgi:serine phosphatase RsbU (regulator of sigma subunit)